MLQNVGVVVAGLALLVAGAQLLVKGASRLALALGIAPLVVGLTIVAFGTSAPELAVSIQSCLADKTALVLGNVVGSNIYNVLFILGICATITPLSVAGQLIRFDVPLMIGAALTLVVVTLDRNIGRVEGIAMVCALAGYTVFTVLQSRKETPAVKEANNDPRSDAKLPDTRYWLHILLILIGLGMLTFGSDLLVHGAVAIAQALGVSETIIGMTVVTIGTTAPELSACLAAAWQGEKDIAVGNIVGSNIFNVLAVLGMGGIVAPHGIAVDANMAAFAIPVMVAVCFSCLPIFFAGQAIRRWEGILFLAYFALYLAYLIMEEIHDARIMTLQHAVLWFIAPLTVLTLTVSAWRELKKRKALAVEVRSTQ